MNPKKQTIADGVRWNQGRPCKAPGCTEARHRVSGYCRSHQTVFTRWGHPLAKNVTLADYAAETQEVRQLIESNPDHPGIRAGIGFVTGLLSGVAIPNRPIANERLARLRGHVDPIDLLIDIVAVFTFSQRNRGKRVHSDLHELHLLGNKVLTYGRRVAELCDPSAWPPNEKLPRAKGLDFRAVGLVVMQGIGVLCLNIHRSLMKKSEARSRSLLAQSKEI